MSTSRREKLRRQALHQKQKEDRKYEQLFREVSCRKQEFKTYVPSTPYLRETQNIPSATPSNKHFSAEKKEARQYGGDYLVGIATLHKSNMVPVGKEDSPESYAQMRRN